MFLLDLYSFLHSQQIIIKNLFLLNFKRSKLLIYKTTWTDFKSIMLRERRQAQKTTHCMRPFLWYSRKGNTIGTENKLISRSWGWKQSKGLMAQRTERTLKVMKLFFILILVKTTWLQVCQNAWKYARQNLNCGCASITLQL